MSEMDSLTSKPRVALIAYLPPMSYLGYSVPNRLPVVSFPTSTIYGDKFNSCNRWIDLDGLPNGDIEAKGLQPALRGGNRCLVKRSHIPGRVFSTDPPVFIYA